MNHITGRNEALPKQRRDARYERAEASQNESGKQHTRFDHVGNRWLFGRE